MVSIVDWRLRAESGSRFSRLYKVQTDSAMAPTESTSQESPEESADLTKPRLGTFVSP